VPHCCQEIFAQPAEGGSEITDSAANSGTPETLNLTTDVEIIIKTLYMDSNKAERPSFQELEATALYCPRCKEAVPVRKRLLLVLPDGDLYEYLCVYCSSSVGTKTERKMKPIDILI
jgi:hypothetical protein